MEQLDALIGEAVDVLVDVAEYARPGDEMGDQDRSGFALGVEAAAARVVAAAVARDRATGLTWDDVGEWLEMHPDTARRRYGSAAARELRRVRWETR